MGMRGLFVGVQSTASALVVTLSACGDTAMVLPDNSNHLSFNAIFGKAEKFSEWPKPIGGHVDAKAKMILVIYSNVLLLGLSEFLIGLYFDNWKWRLIYRRQAPMELLPLRQVASLDQSQDGS